MKAPSTSDWACHRAIEQALWSYYELRLRYPAAAERMRRAAFNVPAKQDSEDRDNDDFQSIFENVFSYEPLPLKKEAENEELRTIIHATASLIAQVFYLSSDAERNLKRQNDSSWQLQQHGDRAIATMIGDSWRSFERMKHEFFDPSLASAVQVLVDRNARLHRETFEQAEGSVA